MKISKVLKRTFQIFLALVFIIIVAAIAIPYFFKDQIVEKVKQDINKNVNAKVDFNEVSLSLFRSFPNFSFKLTEFEILGIEDFEGLKLAGADHIDFTLDLMSVIRTADPIEIKSFHLEKPEINIKILRNGKANYDIAKTDASATDQPVEADTATYNFLIRLQEYSITDGILVYDDRQGDIYTEIRGLNHSGSGQFTADIYDIFTKTNIDQLTASSGGVSYLKKAKAELDMTLNADMNNMKFTLKENELLLNALKLNFDGFVQMQGDDINMDLTYSAPQNKFKNFLSLIPSAYTADYANVQANGDLQFNGFVKGTYNASGRFPAFRVDLKVDNADIKYPDLPLGITNINTQTRIDSPSSDFDKMTVDVSRFSMKLGNNPFEAVFKLKTPISDPDLDAKINGVIDLEELAKAFPMEDVKTLNGVITSNLSVKTRMSAIDRQDYENIDMKGDLQIENLNYSAEGQPATLIRDMNMQFNPKNVTLNNFDAQLGKSDVKAQGTVDNILAYFSPEKTMKGNLTVRSKLIDANEWLSEEEETTPEPAVTDSEAASEEVFDRFDFTIDSKIDKILYDVYQLDQTSFVGNITPSKATIESFSTKIGNSDFRANGSISNLFNYAFENETLYGKINLNSNFIDLNQFMEEAETTEGNAQTTSNEEPAMEPILVPEKIDMEIDANIGKVTYTNIDLRDINGKLLVKNEAVSMENCRAKTLGGSFTIDGSYNTQDAANPIFDLSYAINSFDFHESFNKLNTFATLAPIGKYIQGTFNSKMSMSGKLGKDMYPDLSTLSIDGFVETMNGIIKGFKPVEQFSSMLNVKELETLKIQNTKNWFEVKNGIVTLKEFDYNYQGIAMEIGGTHGLTSEMNYNIKAKIPRELLEKNAVTAAANQGMKLLEKEASKIGINIKAGEFVNVLFNITGTLTNPKFKLNLLSAEGAATSLKDIAKNIVSEAVDSVKTIAKEKIETVKDTVSKVIDTTKEDLRKKADAEIAKVRAEADKQAKNIRDAAKKLSEETQKTGYANADKLIEEAGNNILKKKGAEIAANNLRKETDKKVNQILEEGDKKAQAVIDNVEKQVDAILEKYDLD